MAGERAGGEGHCEPGPRDLRKRAVAEDIFGSLPSGGGGGDTEQTSTTSERD